MKEKKDYGKPQQCTNQFCSSSKRKHFPHEHCGYDIMGTCYCGKEINFRSWDYQKHCNTLIQYLVREEPFIPMCSEHFKRELIGPHNRKQWKK